jgi:tetratricopeptide (TPR) repeat protein
MIMDIGTTTGLLGLATCLCFYVLVLAFLAREWLRTRDLTNSILIAALLLAYLFQSLFTFDTVNTDVVVFLVVAYVAYLYGSQKFQHSRIPGQSLGRLGDPRFGWVAIAAAGGVLVSAHWHLIKQPYRANLLLNQAIGLQKARTLHAGSERYVYREEILELYKQASDLQTAGRYEVREELATYASELAQAPYIPPEVRVRVVRRAVELLEESIRQNPSVFRHHMYLATLVNRTFEVIRGLDPSLARSLAEKNLISLQEAERLSPTRPPLFIERAQSLSFLGRPGDAIAALEKAIQLSPVVKEPHIDLIELYISVGRYDEAMREWQKIKGLSPPPTASDYERVIGSYHSNRQFAPIIVLYKEQLEKIPDDAVLLSRLAAAYRDNGDVELARQTALKAAALWSQAAAGLQSFLESLDKPK